MMIAQPFRFFIPPTGLTCFLSLSFLLSILSTDFALGNNSFSSTTATADLLPSSLDVPPTTTDLKRGLATASFEPTSLDFSCLLSELVAKKVAFTNREPKKSILVIDVVSFDPAILVNPIQSVLLEPNQTFDFHVLYYVVELGSFRGIVTLQTDSGDYDFEVRGTRNSNTFGVSPSLSFQGVPVGVPFLIPIDLSNTLPNDDLIVTGIETNTSLVTINLPNEPEDFTDDLWRVPSGRNHTVANLVFLTVKFGSFYGYLKMFTSGGIFVTLLTFETIEEPLYYFPSFLDFGVLDERLNKSLAVNFYTVSEPSQPLSITSVSVVADEHSTPHTSCSRENEKDFLCFLRHEPLYSHSVPTRPEEVISPLSRVNQILFTPSSIRQGFFSGQILFTLASHQTVVKVPYRAEVIHKTFELLDHSIFFHVDPQTNSSAVLGGEFVIVASVSTPFPLSSFTSNDTNFLISLGPVEQKNSSFWHVIQWELKDQIPKDQVVYCSQIDILFLGVLRQQRICGYTGLLSFSWMTSTSSDLHPLETCESLENWAGQVKPGNLDEEDDLDFGIDFGAVVLNEKAFRFLVARNPNPLNVDILSIESDFRDITLRSDKIPHPCNDLSLPSDPELLDTISASDSLVSLPPNHCFVLAIELTVSCEEEQFGLIQIMTQFQIFQARTHFQGLSGSLYINPTPLQFNPSFPGRVTQKSLLLRSTFSEPVVISHIKSNDSRIIPALLNDTLLPHKRTQVGYIIFDPSKLSHDMDLVDSPKNLSPPGRALTQQDIQEVERRRLFWEQLQRSGETDIKASIKIVTNVSHVFHLSVIASLIRPSLFTQDILDFSIAQIGAKEENSKYIPIHNPSDQHIHVQLLHPSSSSLLCRDCSQETQSETLLGESESGSPFYFPSEALQGTVLTPHSYSYLGPVYFRPRSKGNMEATLYVKNNLTILESLILRGTGSSADLTFFRNDQPEVEVDVLAFDVDPEQLLSCSDSDVIIVKSLLAVNKGMLPVEVHRLSINLESREGARYDVSPPKPLFLGAGEKSAVEISLRPSFDTISSLIRGSFVASSSQGEIVLPLEVHFPIESVNSCMEENKSGHSYLQSLLIFGCVVWLLIAIRAQFFSRSRVSRSMKGDRPHGLVINIWLQFCASIPFLSSPVPSRSSEVQQVWELNEEKINSTGLTKARIHSSKEIGMRKSKSVGVSLCKADKQSKKSRSTRRSSSREPMPRCASDLAQQQEKVLMAEFSPSSSPGSSPDLPSKKKDRKDEKERGRKEQKDFQGTVETNPKLNGCDSGTQTTSRDLGPLFVVDPPPGDSSDSFVAVASSSSSQSDSHCCSDDSSLPSLPSLSPPLSPLPSPPSPPTPLSPPSPPSPLSPSSPPPSPTPPPSSKDKAPPLPSPTISPTSPVTPSSGPASTSPSASPSTPSTSPSSARNKVSPTTSPAHNSGGRVVSGGRQNHHSSRFSNKSGPHKKVGNASSHRNQDSSEQIPALTLNPDYPPSSTATHYPYSQPAVMFDPQSGFGYGGNGASSKKQYPKSKRNQSTSQRGMKYHSSQHSDGIVPGSHLSPKFNPQNIRILRHSDSTTPTTSSHIPSSASVASPPSSSSDTSPSSLCSSPASLPSSPPLSSSPCSSPPSSFATALQPTLTTGEEEERAGKSDSLDPLKKIPQTKVKVPAKPKEWRGHFRKRSVSDPVASRNVLECMEDDEPDLLGTFSPSEKDEPKETSAETSAGVGVCEVDIPLSDPSDPSFDPPSLRDSAGLEKGEEEQDKNVSWNGELPARGKHSTSRRRGKETGKSGRKEKEKRARKGGRGNGRYGEKEGFQGDHVKGQRYERVDPRTRVSARTQKPHKGGKYSQSKGGAHGDSFDKRGGLNPQQQYIQNVLPVYYGTAVYLSQFNQPYGSQPMYNVEQYPARGGTSNPAAQNQLSPFSHDYRFSSGLGNSDASPLHDKKELGQMAVGISPGRSPPLQPSVHSGPRGFYRNAESHSTGSLDSLAPSPLGPRQTVSSKSSYSQHPLQSRSKNPRSFSYEAPQFSSIIDSVSQSQPGLSPPSHSPSLSPSQSPSQSPSLSSHPPRVFLQSPVSPQKRASSLSATPKPEDPPVGETLMDGSSRPQQPSQQPRSQPPLQTKSQPPLPPPPPQLPHQLANSKFKPKLTPKPKPRPQSSSFPQFLGPHSQPQPPFHSQGSIGKTGGGGEEPPPPLRLGFLSRGLDSGSNEDSSYRLF